LPCLYPAASIQCDINDCASERSAGLEPGMPPSRAARQLTSLRILMVRYTVWRYGNFSSMRTISLHVPIPPVVVKSLRFMPPAQVAKRRVLS
jgi:hypothetical protein